MPRGDGTGPLGRGAMTGRGLGPCAGAPGAGAGFGMGACRGFALRRGFRQGFGAEAERGGDFPASKKEWLTQQKEFLKDRLEAVNEELESL